MAAVYLLVSGRRGLRRVGERWRRRTLAVVLTGAVLVATAAPAPATADPQGTITEFGPTGAEPSGITAGPDGNLWFTETQANRIGRITPAGAITEFPLPGFRLPSAITAGPDGNLWFIELFTNSIAQITTSGVLTHEFPVPATLFPFGLSPPGLSTGPDGNLWFTDPNGSTIGRITTAGAVTEFPVPTSFPGGNIGNVTSGITAGPDGNLWVTQSLGIARITPSGVVTGQFLTAFEASGITTGPDGNLWVVSAEPSIERVTPAGSLVSPPIVQIFAGASAITAGPDGNLWVTANNNNEVVQITPTGTSTPFALPTPGGLGLAEPSFPSSGLAVGPDGNMWFTEPALPTGGLFGAGKIGRIGSGAIDTTAPSCALTAVIAGPPKQIQITLQETDGGLLQAIVPTVATNAAVTIPPFVADSIGTLTVTATKIDQTQGAQVALQVSDVAGNVTDCDPILATVGRDSGVPQRATFHHVARGESRVTIYNDTPGLSAVRLSIDGRSLEVKDLAAGEKRSVDVSALMHTGDNTITLQAQGKAGGTATVLITDN